MSSHIFHCNDYEGQNQLANVALVHPKGVQPQNLIEYFNSL